ncbi:hypothetical protein [Microbulbifer sp. HZ11]|uniref:hypothetical protein n=1 Tax=unclassified Microbulbifer TaxID=2619833 RepID=UPI0005BCA58B|nr:hypothetical protein [Microbulbifer sp. HZ11]
MKLGQAQEEFKAGRLDEVQIRKNPSDIRQWFVMVRTTDGASLILADEQDAPIVDRDLTRLVGILKDIGCKEARIYP